MTTVVPCGRGLDVAAQLITGYILWNPVRSSLHSPLRTGTLTSMMSRVVVQAEEVGRTLHDRNLLRGEFRKAIADKVLYALGVVAFVNGVLTAHVQSVASFNCGIVLLTANFPAFNSVSPVFSRKRKW